MLGGEDVELRNVSLSTPLNRNLNKDVGAYEERKIFTTKGVSVTVAIKGDPSKPALLTFHDLGLNFVSNFQAFFNYPDMVEIAEKFCVYHVNAPGQEEGAEIISEHVEYPNMEDLAEIVNEVINELKIVRYVGIGVGLGGNVLLRHAYRYPERLHCLVLVNTLCTVPGWVEWGYQKRNVNHLRNHGVTQAVTDYLLWHHFGVCHEERAHDLVNIFKQYFSTDIQPKNLAKLMEQYNWRTAIQIDREFSLENQGGNAKTLKTPILNIVGAYSPFSADTVVLNGKLNPQTTSWMKIHECTMVLEEQPAKMAEAFRLFVQGHGFCINIRKNAVGVVQ
ncbi:protein NDRG3 [Lepeophtheirus salmonis]|uniref:Protein NDRG3 n=1 Tax=Lepeophtheirus salmonis TaxID=72036 RepID=D3PHU1_LEPSM|nr:protein NDRG3-like [Lepeophtheirus salmonis]ADD38127.1 Protein NDRG3 [Lepeophtheirus salmonis]